MHHILPALVIFMLFSGTAGASFHWSKKCMEAHEAILELRFGDAEKLIRAEKAAMPDNHIVSLLENYIDFLTLVIGEEQQEFYSRQSRKKARMEVYGKDKAYRGPWQDFCVAETELQWAFARLKFGETLTAAKEMSRAYHILEKIRGEYPDFLPAKKSMGLLHCLIGSIPDKYKWIADLKGLHGSIEEGRKELTEVMENKDPIYGWLSPEAEFFLAFVLQNLENDPEASEIVLKKYEKNIPSTPLSVYAASSLAIRKGRSGLALTILSSFKPAAGSFPFHYLSYLEGLCLLYDLDTTCRSRFRQYLENFEGRTFRASALQKLAWSYLICDDTLTYQSCISSIDDKNLQVTDEDRQAVKEKKTARPHPVLLRTRLLTDGGHYQQALKELIEVKPSEVFHTTRELAESAYRLGRIYQLSGKTIEAAGVFRLVYDNYSSYPWYYAANAALQLGVILENDRKKEQAADWYRKCMKVKDHEYKESLDQKARAGLNRLGY